MRTSVARPTPYRGSTPYIAEVAINFPLLLERAGITGEFDPASLRVIERGFEGIGCEVPFAYRIEFDARKHCEQTYLTWFARPEESQTGIVDIYFDTRDRAIEAAGMGDFPHDAIVTTVSLSKVPGGIYRDNTSSLL